MNELEKAYDASKVEADIYKKWEASGYFTPENLPDAENREPFTIVLPPPNVTGTLHMGHAFEDTMQDILVRFERMRGKRALWLPGTDHAPIATESKVAKILEKEEGKRKHEYNREEFVQKVKDFATQSHDTIVGQVRSMGASVDWTREAYTFDDARNLAVRTAFKNMFDQDLIYRGYRVVNWDPKGQTTISDDEIVHEERKAKLYTFRYSKDFPIPISTTRPETKVGDTAVAVHPSDERYSKFVGKEYDIEFCGVPIHIKIVADESVEKEFGTGALGVTPAHSQIDWEIAQRHNLPLKPVIDERAKMTVGGDNLLGKKTSEARETVVTWLQEQGILEKEEDVVQNISTAERTGGVIEPLPKLQWFINVNKEFSMAYSEIEGISSGDKVTLKKLMRHVVESKQIKIAPDRFEKTYFQWVDNLRDWCISRQLWFGHRIPAWFPATINIPNNPSFDNELVKVSIEDIDDPKWVQDPDTLDTWFSSGLWTFSTLGWPNKTKDLQTYHPTSVINPGYEILFFWVARMILMTTYNTGQIPFKQIVLHGMVRDKQGRKFSKSLNNGVDPLDMTSKYGTDALRMALVFGAAPGNDTVFDEQRVKGMKHFANKLWNISRFIMMNLENSKFEIRNSKPAGVTEADKEILAKLNETIASVTKNIETFQLHEAAQSLYQFVWHELADVYIEASKIQLQDEELKVSTLATLHYSLVTVLKLLHPFMPFITEEIWNKLEQKNLLMIEDWPK